MELQTELKWRVNERAGSFPIRPGENRLSVPVRPDEVLNTVRAELSIPPSPKMFFNGYQTWTYCPEYAPGDRIRGLGGFPKIGLDLTGIDRFGDYHFIRYPHRRGVFHGFSYCYFRNGETYRLIASLDERPGYTLFTYDVSTERLTLERDCKGVAADGTEFPAFAIFYAEGSEKEVFDRWFEALGIRSSAPRIRGYSSWYNHYTRINGKNILEDLRGARALFEPGDLFQIDDGWESRVGDWETADSRKFPNGIKPLVREIHDAGFKAGLWLAPFVCSRHSGLFHKHPDRLLRYRGKPWLAGPNWGGFFALDIDHPGVREYLRGVFSRIFEDWGFDFVKLDFLYAAAPFATGNHGERSDMPFRESRAGRMIRAMEFLRKCCDGKRMLSCGVPLMPAFGLTDYCRIGPDMGLDWDDFPLMRLLHRERVSTRQSLGNTIFRRELDGRAFGNDPDVFFLRDRNLRLNAKEKDYLAAVNALFGSVWLTSDDLNGYDDAKTALYREYAQLRNAEEIRIDPDTLSISYTLHGRRHSVPYPH